MRNSLKTVLDIVLPARCPVTGQIVSSSGLVAPDVWPRLDRIERPFCACCGIRFDVPVDPEDLCPACLEEHPAFDAARAVFVYNDQSRDMVLGFKHGDQTHLVKSFLPWLDRVVKEFQDSTDLIVPVPLHSWRLLARRYNQAALLSGALARLWGCAHDPLVLKRNRSTPSQGHLHRNERIKNVEGAFSVLNPDRIKGQRVLLVDDVYTTGATVCACSEALKKAGARHVFVVTLARVMRPVTID